MTWVNAVVQGILLGGLYALFACGLSLMFGVMRIINLAHGDLALFGTFMVLVVSEHVGLSPFAALVIVLPGAAVVGYALQRGIFDRSLRAGRAGAPAGDVRAVGGDRQPAAGDLLAGHPLAERRRADHGELADHGPAVDLRPRRADLRGCRAGARRPSADAVADSARARDARDRGRPSDRRAGWHQRQARVRGGHRDRPGDSGARRDVLRHALIV